jgi:hypothetical protein
LIPHFAPVLSTASMSIRSARSQVAMSPMNFSGRVETKVETPEKPRSRSTSLQSFMKPSISLLMSSQLQ